MIRIGKIVATHGLQGTMVFAHTVGNATWLKPDAALMLEQFPGSLIPYFVASVKASNHEEYLITFDDITSVEAAKKLVGKAIFGDEKLLSGHENDSPLLWVGFDVVDKTLGSLGSIVSVNRVGPQWLATIVHQEKEVLIPLIEQMIIDVSLRHKFIRMDLPEGLLTL
jgi:16S rRNA processing protein RimM